ncbi:MAG: dTDP-4-dehydrorhamnose 3,5-epimerase [Acidobacteriota bacterium]
MKVTAARIPGVLELEPRVFGDERGFFLECWNAKAFREATGLDVTFVQDNHARSSRGVLRGLHYQLERPQGKLVQVARGRIFDVAVDLRRSSPAFGRWVGVELSDEDHRQVWIPPGLAHGYLVLSDEADVTYKATEFYAPEAERTILWSDADLAIAWPHDLGEQPIISARDAAGTPFTKADVFD